MGSPRGVTVVGAIQHLEGAATRAQMFQQWPAMDFAETSKLLYCIEFEEWLQALALRLSLEASDIGSPETG